MTLKHKSFITLGDSKVKQSNRWRICKCLQSDCKVYLKQFSSAGRKCLKYYIKSLLQENPSHFILHVGKNDLNLKKPPELRVKSIVDVATTLKN